MDLTLLQQLNMLRDSQTSKAYESVDVLKDIAELAQSIGSQTTVLAKFSKMGKEGYRAVIIQKVSDLINFIETALGQEDFRCCLQNSQKMMGKGSMVESMLSQSDIGSFQQGVKAIQLELESKLLGSETSNNLFKAINMVKQDITKMMKSGNKQLEESILSNVSMLEENLTRQNDLIREELNNLSGRFEEYNDKFVQQIEEKLLNQSATIEKSMSQQFEKLEQKITTGGAGAIQQTSTQSPQSLLTQSSFTEKESGPLSLEHIDLNKYQFSDCTFIKKRINIQHPYKPVQEDNSHKDMIEVLFEGEVHKGIPHGLGYVTYDKDEKFLNFSGVATFNKGIIDGGSAIFLCGDGQKFVFSSMKKGRPFGCGKKYLFNAFETNFLTINKKINVGGWAQYLGNFHDAQFHGQGALMVCDPQGTLFHGKFEKDLMHSGKLSVLPASGKGVREIFHAQFNTCQRPITTDPWTQD
ncbi:hypothetical protein FGO68_gene3021 [Halteria grandinella]|uniref:Uncharacterized protein n=1 Tax=Halteria grandinella TaxID=5974 RepID=A0A8J8NQB1_HALGN|nr:hypothetical protein FGO68_gene3021 [Halteria grandinella]